ncbi:Outer membrane porin protein 32 [Cupriavidus yeoncheonensis]|uniref:Outer membrane porin protein 32 n=1 Tax=Cupriavidus yeoncheonensis TaxID=1462994 RepID=A0A916NDQ7_9BURK|nr:porin [Cupriavidus yeoncheonensis]CAG2141856.1 Outer membrane porin protein 32 [Cupriavidus yeoncheonensis]
MKQKMLAVTAAVLASTGAYAQSSVTLYGVADVGVEYLSKADGTHSRVAMTSGNMSGSRWGIRGVEDLGGGLKGVFTLESGFTIDDGKTADTTGNRFFNRQAYVGLQSSYGTVTLGRHQTPLYDYSLMYDPMAIASRYSIAVQDPTMGSQRADNSIKYLGTFGGLTASALYSFGYNANGEIPGNYKAGKEYSAGLNYATGPLSVGAVYDLMQPNDVVKDQRFSVAGTYAFGPAKAFAGYRWEHVTTGVASAVANLYWLGLGYQVTPALSLTGAAYYQDLRSTKADPWSFVVSADYAFSKRTDAYFNMGYVLNRSDNNVGIYSNALLGGSNATGDKINQFGALVGIRHKF